MKDERNLSPEENYEQAKLGLAWLIIASCKRSLTSSRMSFQAKG